MGESLIEVRHLSARLNGFDDIREIARHWDLDFRLLGTGRGAGTIEVTSSRRSVLQRNRFGWKLHQRGAAPNHMRTFGIGLSNQGPFPWRGFELDGDWLVSFPEDGTFESVSGKDFHVYTLSFDDDLVHATAEALQLPLDSCLSREAAVRSVTPRAANSIRATLKEVRRLAVSRRSADRESQLTRLMEGSLLVSLLQAFDEGHAERIVAPSLRARAVRLATELIEQEERSPLAVAEVCEAVGVSWRTLDYAFKERYGISPKAFMKSRRLNGVRQILREARPETTVRSAASRWGFWHMSQFARDYRKLFGELPSETLYQ
jgi:AraC-like DNA-binding protein